MTGSAGIGNGRPARSGAQTLSLLAAPLSVQILRGLADGPMQQVELRRACGTPPQSTLRGQLKALHAAGAIGRRRRDRFPGILDCELSEAGRDLLSVATVMERWLAGSPEGPLELGDSPARTATKALVGGWSACMLRVLAARPLTLTELDGVIASLNYPSLERRLGAMRLAGEIAAHTSGGRGTPYRVTPWGCAAVAPLLAAARWERRHAHDRCAPIGKVDVEAAFLMAMPLLRLPPDASGSCRMAADVHTGSRPHDPAGVLVETREGRIVSCNTRLEGSPDAWASGTAGAWLAATIDGDDGGLELGGDASLARILLEGLHAQLFSPQRR